MLSAKALAGPGYVILNGVRAMNITALLATICASIVMLVKIKTDSAFFFFDAISHVITTFLSIFVIVTECNIFQRYFQHSWPAFSDLSGFVTLGLAMVAMGVELLGNLNKGANSKENLGLAFWRIVTGSGILMIILGTFNMIASFVFRDRVCGVTARQVRAQGAPAVTTARALAESRSKSFRSNSSASDKGDVSVSTSKSSKKSSRRWTTNRFNLPILPSYHHATSPATASSKYSDRDDEQNGRQREMEISPPTRINPQFAHLVRPDSCYHPARNS